MKALYILALLSFFKSFEASSYYVMEGSFTVTDKYPGGFTGRVDFPVVRDYRYGWLINITFNIEIEHFKFYEGKVKGRHPNKKLFIVQNEDYNVFLHKDASGKRRFFCEGKCSSTPTAEIRFIPLMDAEETFPEALARADATGITGDTLPTLTPTLPSNSTLSPLDAWLPSLVESSPFTTSTVTQSTTTTSTSTTATPAPNLKDFNLRYNLRDVITKSLLFFEAQRSGALPSGNRIKWRSHSALKDGLPDLVDLSGGYYVDGGYVKYNFPMAFSTTFLAWGLLEFRNSYLASHQIPYIMNALKWTTDYFIKCHVSPFVFYAQVSSPTMDSQFWGRPEEFNSNNRPIYKIDRRNRGSDLAAEAAAAMAATAIVFKETNETYSSELIRHAEQLYMLAKRYQGVYSESIPEAATSYKSWNGFHDELAWAALWLYKATKNENYISLAKKRLDTNPDKSNLTSFSWDDKRAGALVLLAQITGEETYRLDVMNFCDSFLPGRAPLYTPRGLVFIQEWGPLRHAANVGALCLVAAKIGLRPEIYRQFAFRQLAYMLGDGGRSYVVGFGANPPTRPYHRASSCPDKPAPCTWDNKEVDKPNPQELTGALVGGPDKWDSYADDRNDYKGNSVALDYNAGLQTLAAGILEIQVTGETFSEPNPEELNAAVSKTFSIKHDYGEVLRLSLLFYEAQRSGELPNDNRIPWRRSAFTDDAGYNGTDLSGGYFDAGDYIKFNFPMAYTTTVLSWGLLQYRDAYEAVGEMDNGRKAIKWATDYFIKCHISKYVLYGQVGSGTVEHSYWLKPQDMELISRPAFNITEQRPGTELAAETAAAMAAASLLFRDSDPDYADVLIAHAKDLYEFADKFRENYHRSIPEVSRFYRSYSGFEDELVWAALWLYSATRDQKYFKVAQVNYDHFKLGEDDLDSFFWDEKTAGVQLLLAQFTQRKTYRKAVRKFCDSFLPENGHQHTPKGLVYINQWGALRHAAGVSFICLGAANLGIRPERYRELARRQIHYMLGDSGLGSYVVGYGPMPPTRPHHRASSCPDPPQKCGFIYLQTSLPNPHLLKGALVGGPDINDRYADDRNNYKSNEVALDYNAGFQSAIAALKYLELHPPVTTTTKPNSTTVPPTTKTTEDIVDIIDSTDSTEEFIGIIDSTDSIESIIDNIDGWHVGEGGLQPLSTSESTVRSDITTAAKPIALQNKNSTVIDTTAPLSKQTTVVEVITRGSNVATTDASTTAVVTSEGAVHTTADTTALSTHHVTTTALRTTSILQTTAETTSLLPRVIRLTVPTELISHPKWVIYPDECRPVDIFNLCSIDKRTYWKHKASRHYYCRYHAFQACVDHQGMACDGDILWGTYPYWNSEKASDYVYFPVEDEKCKDPKTVALEECKVGGVTESFENCYVTSGNTRNTTKQNFKTCRWRVFEACVNGLVGHCSNTWDIWKFWNSNSGNPYFNLTQAQCYSSKAPTISSRLFLVAFIVSAFYIVLA